jgi:hypothetical protein
MSQKKAKKWFINIFILIIAIVFMLVFAEIAMRWIDNYQLTTIELEQNPGK